MAATSEVDQIFAEFTEPGSSGASVGVFRDGEAIYTAGFGLADLEHGIAFTPQTVVNLGSTAKQFTAFLIALLDSEGALSLEDDIRHHLPELHDFGHVITVRHLIHHLSGLRDSYPELFVLGGWRMSDVMTGEDLLRLMTSQRELNYQPGDEFLYINSGYGLLALIVERASGMSFARAARQRIFAPLGMAATSVRDDFQTLIPGAAGSYYRAENGIWKRLVVTDSVVGPTNVWSSVDDLARWDRNFVTGEVGGRSLADRLSQPATLNDGSPVAYGFGLEAGSTLSHRGWRIVEHGGQHGGHCSSLIRFPDAGLSVVVLFNAFRWDTREYGIRVADLFLEDRSGRLPDPKEPRVPDRVDVGNLAKYSGIYLDLARAAVRRVTVEEGRLTYDGFALVALAPERFCFEIDPEVELRFGGSGEHRTVTTFTSQGTYAYGLVPPPALHPDALGQLAGKYASPELGVVWNVEQSGEQLIAHRHRYPDTVLTPVFADGFTDDWTPVVGFGLSFLVIFHRDAAGRATSLTVSGSGVRRLRFDRIGSPEGEPDARDTG
jgi:CubicO group peptidase (beta-lactamase class C family)